MIYPWFSVVHLTLLLHTLILKTNEKLELISHDLVLFQTNGLIWMKSMPYSALVLELVHVFETSARTSSISKIIITFFYIKKHWNIDKITVNFHTRKYIITMLIHYRNIVWLVLSNNHHKKNTEAIS